MAEIIRFDVCRLQPVSISALRDRSTFAFGKVIEAETVERMRMQREARLANRRLTIALADDRCFGQARLPRRWTEEE